MAIVVSIKQLKLQPNGSIMVTYKARNRQWQRMIVNTRDANTAIQEVLDHHASLYDTTDVQVKYVR